MSSFLDWGVITEAKKSGVYSPGNQVQPRKADHLAWLAEAVLISRAETQMRSSELFHHPILFPISLDAFNASFVRANSRLSVARQGLNEEVVMLDTESGGLR